MRILVDRQLGISQKGGGLAHALTPFEDGCGGIASTINITAISGPWPEVEGQLVRTSTGTFRLAVSYDI